MEAKALNLAKRKIVKWTLVFLVSVLIFTIFSKTTYTFLLPEVTTEKVASGRIETKLFAEGQIGHDELTIDKKKVAVKSTIEGEVIACYVEELQEVKKGDTLMKIQGVQDENKLAQTAQQKMEVEINQSIIDRQQQEYEEKKMNLEEKLGEKQEEQVNEEKSYEMLKLENQIKEKKKAVENYEALAKEGLIAQEEYSKSKEELVLLEVQKNKLVEDETHKLKLEIEELEEEIKGVESNLAALDEKRALEANKLLTQEQVGKVIDITSPMDGIIYELDIAVGATALQNTQLLMVVPKEIPITLSFKMNNKDTDKIKVGQSVNWINNQIREEAIVVQKSYDEVTKEIIVTCEVDEALVTPIVDGFKAYKGVNVEIINTSDTYELLVSASAIVREGMSAYIYSVEEIKTTFETQYRVHKNLVTLIKEGDYTCAISGSIKPKDEIVKTTTKPLSDEIEVNKK